MVQQVVAQLQEQEKQRTIDFTIDQLPPAQADPTMLQQVWANLIGNAVKYTGQKEKALVHIGAEANGSETIYFVKDNGAGFDMKYADKLFGVFQRLHAASEFEGTGVGLATVQRIITRHGGRVWADAKPGEGATFYFSLVGR
jgi:light-regulated signal transduction histidine kinase (bacteriophytochrome)